MKTTNYFNTFIEIAEDCPVQSAEIPPQKRANKTVAAMQYEVINRNPYKYTSDDVIFHIFAERNDVPQNRRARERKKFFAKGQPCLRSSPLPKRYGWGIHSDADGKIALYAMESERYQRLDTDKNIKHLKAMRSKRG